ncbi:DMT family transporter [Roseitranquillus sediminis]|uniref:DMT family transporter n=1 Tax=Roseitranquillus sediminis TaxID=2809051 RepID=UPI001D0C9933|nr:DMT family transporter [Roseitranquillus sediminis]MBM9593713.1 DMT family transporter [Roseitranquillus sediminis]
MSARGSERREIALGQTEIAFAMMLASTMLLPVGDTLSKLLTAVAHPAEIAFWRLAFQTLVLGTAAWLMPRRVTGRLFSPILALGGVAAAATLVLLIAAFSTMPIATAIAIFFVEPLILTVLSAFLLNEPVGWRRYLAVFVGLIGAVVVIRPNWSIFGAYTILPLGAAVAFALNMILIRIASRTRSGLAIQVGMSFYAALLLGAGLVAGAALGLFAWTGTHGPAYLWPMYVAAGCLSGVTFLLIAGAYRRAPASVLAPMQYFEILGATLMGYIVFGDFPDALTWLGTAIILGSGLYVFHRERRQ